jgi:hypothetical protein
MFIILITIKSIEEGHFINLENIITVKWFDD